MTAVDLLTLAALEDLISTRVEVVRVVVDEQGRELCRLHRGFYVDTSRASHNSDPNSKRDTI
jgi:hypothetical protein